MSDILSQDEINALLSSMEGGGDIGFGFDEPEPEAIVSNNNYHDNSSSNNRFSLANAKDETIRNIFDTKLELIVMYGSRKINIASLIGLKAGKVLELNKVQNEPVDIMVNGSYIAVGQLIVVDGVYAVRLSNLVSPETRLKSLKTQ